MEHRRTLLWISPSPDPGVTGLALSSHWDIHQINLHQPPRDLSNGNGARVGVLDLHGCTDEDFPLLEDWLNTLNPTTWVGLTDKPPAQDPNLSHVIGTHCADYHTLPLDQNRLDTVLGHLWGMARLRSQLAGGERATLQHCALSGHSTAIRQTRSLLQRFASTLEPVLIYGASGTGKETAARYIHDHSPVSHGPFISVNCAALPPSLTQRELFGDENGTPDGAAEAHIGRFEAAHGGSLLLMGINELLPEQQSALLRFLQDGALDQVGSKRPRQIRTRIIATSSQPLDALVQSNEFRKDVFYRLGGLSVRLPELRERLEDLPELVEHFFASAASQGNRIHWQLNEAAMRALMAHSWPGNIRELDNRLHQAILLGEDQRLSPQDLGFQAQQANANDDLSLDHFRAQAEQQAVRCSLAMTHNNVSAAARLLDISRVSLYRLMEKHKSAMAATEDTSSKPRNKGL
ncbi:sigma-54 dependent transcriptional regulator [Marinobacter mobilis]|uniref:DNA-binding transcriptional response regulator, NtrC family, contains REC, AAA-type ATPase, and a Fis-type DNA-binding domains n=1 Tax=Marinobacter mobilis TaxID=488533 RepID=A0A1H2QGZ9_9GAMM|nr:sigma-54 dependent transcriptional regulator [Marinobacter mobilis]SDW05904.1 DNA-binding transcriptional response regulator, NtrC family, contains REC, AAA-type ATPase, and a Fis-type DNA-binding domains [Marinobacter mobilis]